MTNESTVRTRFEPSPTGDLTVGGIRTALYAWAYARHTSGTFVLRIADTDKTRAREEYIDAILDSLRWLALQWDEGPEVGGPHAPYRQSERLDIYREWAERFLEDGNAYRCYCTPEETEARRQAARARGEGMSGYDGHCRDLTAQQKAAYEAEGRRPAIRFRMPPGSTTFTDTVRGEITFENAHVPDFVILRADGSPLYTLCAPVDDVLMKLTHILRGDDLLSATPGQIAVYRAMGVKDDEIPVFCHLPTVLGHDGAKLGKRHGAETISWYRQAGFLPEAMVNYLALLGWSPGDNRELFGIEELCRDFTLERVNPNPAKFDSKKLEAINGDKIRALETDDLARRLAAVLQGSGLVADPPKEEEARLVAGATPLVQKRMSRLTDAVGMLSFLFVDEERFAIDPGDAERSLRDEARPALEAATRVLEAVDPWEASEIEQALRGALVDGLGLKPRVAFTPVRVAVTGRRVSPPLFESLALLGREHTLRRLRRAVATLGGAVEIR